jgi:hypothetical protein
MIRMIQKSSFGTVEREGIEKGGNSHKGGSLRRADLDFKKDIYKIYCGTNIIITTLNIDLL